LERHWATRVVFPKPAGASTSTSLAAALASSWISSGRSTHPSRAVGAWSLVSRGTSRPARAEVALVMARTAGGSDSSCSDIRVLPRMVLAFPFPPCHGKDGHVRAGLRRRTFQILTGTSPADLTPLTSKVSVLT